MPGTSPSLACACALGGVILATLASAASAQDRARTLRERPLLTRLGVVSLASVEIPAYDESSNMVFAVAGDDVAMIHLGDGASPLLVRTLGLAAQSAFPPGMKAEVTHVALDPLRRGFAAATVVPEDFAGVPGVALLFSTRTGRVLSRFVVGYNPDAAAFSPDGELLLVANEGQPRVTAQGVLVDPPGSLSVISLSGVGSEFDCARLTQSRVTTVYFDGDALADALKASLDNPRDRFLRVHPRHRASPTLDLEPEYIAFIGDGAYITLQENNAVARFDLGSMRFDRIVGLGLLEQAIDPSDADGPGAAWETVLAAPMPDQLASFSVDGVWYLITPNEGDDRGRFGRANNPLGDEIRVRELPSTLRVSSALRERIESSPALHDLKVCAHSGDLDADGAIDQPVTMGSRSASVWRVASDGSLERVADTGDLFERTMASVAPDRFNANGNARAESRSTARGPEPEGIALASLRGRPVAFIGLERPGAIAALDLSDPANPSLIDLHVSADEGDIAPEGICFIPAHHSPTGRPLLIVAYEVSGTMAVYGIADVEDFVSAAGAARDSAQ
ncbi:MAG: choice-of-anchor I family protein [Phycisphaeraceae bacterium]|nr:choice-of-anchor I family protein [Phycisphaeraceae bacterium]